MESCQYLFKTILLIVNFKYDFLTLCPKNLDKKLESHTDSEDCLSITLTNGDAMLYCRPLLAT